MYTIHVYQGTVVRDSDQKVVAPCESPDDPDFKAYIAWVEAGNTPTSIEEFNGQI